MCTTLSATHQAIVLTPGLGCIPSLPTLQLLPNINRSESPLPILILVRRPYSMRGPLLTVSSNYLNNLFGAC